MFSIASLSRIISSDLDLHSSLDFLFAMIQGVWPNLVGLFTTLLQLSSVSAFKYDYIIVGGGVCGLTIANRLSKLPNVTVAVIEAGSYVLNNTLVTNVDDFTVAWGTSIDWQYESTNQTHAAGQKIAYHSGKALGGSSTINGNCTFEPSLFLTD